MSKPRVMIATPTPGLVRTEYMTRVIATMNDLANRGVYCEFESTTGSDVKFGRNHLATLFLSRPELTHLYFVDSDMIPPPDLCWQMITRNRPMIGTIPTTKAIDAQKIDAALREGMSFNDAALLGGTWLAFLPPNTKNIEVVNGELEVNRVGFGAVVLQRIVLETMIEKGAARLQTSTAGHPASYSFFSPRAEAVLNGEDVGEDMSFCHRWKRDCGGEIWAFVDTTIYHVGDFSYGGSYFAFLQAVSKMQAKTLIVTP